ncbi:hypothetical protein [Microvirga sp. M2]|uniref:hypothetical protein n=1 Tax=Microvirga sp. M2 TaxID=3073270 RepID=UPI0039C2ECF7
MRTVLVALSAGLISCGAALAEGNLASKPTRLDPLVLNKDLSMSVKEYQLSTGKYYKWTVESKGGDEFRISAPELFRNSWIDQIVINDIEVKPMGGIYGVEFDEPGKADIWFVPVRPGNYEFYVPGQQERGMIGKFIVR